MTTVQLGHGYDYHVSLQWLCRLLVWVDTKLAA